MKRAPPQVSSLPTGGFIDVPADERHRTGEDIDTRQRSKRLDVMTARSAHSPNRQAIVFLKQSALILAKSALVESSLPNCRVLGCSPVDRSMGESPAATKQAL